MAWFSLKQAICENNIQHKSMKMILEMHNQQSFIQHLPTGRQNKYLREEMDRT
jgi:hypothetical protein